MGSLTRPFSVTWGIRQGCPLSELLYAISIEPLLVSLRNKLHSVNISSYPDLTPVKLTAYADDVTVFISNVDDINTLTACLNGFQKATSACINGEKCITFLMGE